LFEARNPSNPAVVSEVDGIVNTERSSVEIAKSLWTSRTGDVYKYLVPLSKHILGAGQ
jgi:DNA-directed RNA polymerase subunit beta'